MLKFLCVAVLLVARCVRSDREMIEEFMTKPESFSCMTETGFNPMEMADGPPSDPPESLLCFIKCMAEKSGGLDSDGTINLDKMRELDGKMDKMPEDAVNRMKECAGTVKIKTCQDVAKFINCVKP